MKHVMLAASLFALSAGSAFADAETFVFDPHHSSIRFSWTHAGFSTTYGMFLDVNGEMELDRDNPAASSVTASVPLSDMIVQADMKGHFAGDKWFGGMEGKMVEFASTRVELTGETTAKITGDLTVNGATKEIVLDAVLNKIGKGPNGDEVAGFDATTTILRSDYGVGAFAPVVSDEVEVEISVEAKPAM